MDSCGKEKKRQISTLPAVVVGFALALFFTAVTASSSSVTLVSSSIPLPYRDNRLQR
jgi:hypothetical protein